MSNYSALTSKIVHQTRAQETMQGMIDPACYSRFFLHPNPTKVCVFFHGFTATPSQFLPIGEAFFQAGYNVLIPLLPGHGRLGNWSGDHPPPLPEDPQVYQQFGLHWLGQAHALGKEVVLGGLSGGGTLAAWLALACPQQIQRTLMFAPYLSNHNRVVDVLVRILDIYFEWRTKPGSAHFGYEGFLMPALEVFLNMGQDVLDQAQNHPAAPMFIVSSKSDRAINSSDLKALFKAVVKRQPKSWYYSFDRSLEVPHTMMTQAEGNNYQDLLIAIAKAYVESDLTWAQVKDITQRVRQGKPFTTAVSELNLNRQAASGLSTMIATMLDQPLP